MKVVIESWTYPHPLNTMENLRVWQAHVEDEYGTCVAECPSRDSRDQAEDDARLFREQYADRPHGKGRQIWRTSRIETWLASTTSTSLFPVTKAYPGGRRCGRNSARMSPTPRIFRAIRSHWSHTGHQSAKEGSSFSHSLAGL